MSNQADNVKDLPVESAQGGVNIAVAAPVVQEGTPAATQVQSDNPNRSGDRPYGNRPGSSPHSGGRPPGGPTNGDRPSGSGDRGHSGNRPPNSGGGPGGNRGGDRPSNPHHGSGNGRPTATETTSSQAGGGAEATLTEEKKPNPLLGNRPSGGGVSRPRDVAGELPSNTRRPSDKSTEERKGGRPASTADKYHGADEARKKLWAAGGFVAKKTKGAVVASASGAYALGRSGINNRNNTISFKLWQIALISLLTTFVLVGALLDIHVWAFNMAFGTEEVANAQTENNSENEVESTTQNGNIEEVVETTNQAVPLVGDGSIKTTTVANIEAQVVPYDPMVHIAISTSVDGQHTCTADVDPNIFFDVMVTAGQVVTPNTVIPGHYKCSPKQ
jgi:hypothetical protein